MDLSGNDGEPDAEESLDFESTLIASADDLAGAIDNVEDKPEAVSDDDADLMEFSLDAEIDGEPAGDSKAEDDFDFSEVDDGNSMEFDLGGFDTGSAADEPAPAVSSEPAENEMEFDLGDMDLSSTAEEPEVVEDLHDEQHSMEFDGDFELPGDEDESSKEADEPAMPGLEFDATDLDALDAGEESPADDLLGSDDDDLGLDFDIGGDGETAVETTAEDSLDGLLDSVDELEPELETLRTRIYWPMTLILTLECRILTTHWLR